MNRHRIILQKAALASAIVVAFAFPVYLLAQEEEAEDSEEFMAYNAILEGKIEALKQHIDHLALSPKYGSLHRFFHNQQIGTCTLSLEYENLRQRVGGVQGFVDSLQGPNGEAVFKELIKEISK